MTATDVVRTSGADRYQPTRAGIVNLWDYRDEEFSFASGWLILRGPNGSGKTKALEVLFPFVLDGRIDPKRLNPFAAEDRTMKSNLLFRGQDSALGYVWLELRHRTDGSAVTIGIGLQAHRHRDTPTRWHFVAEGRLGEDFSLFTEDDRPLTKKQLVEQIGAENLYDTAADYRAAVDRRLFGLGTDRYEQMLTLILTLRRPQLAKNLDPAKLSDTLTGGLRPLDDDLIAEAARSFDDMEAVQRTLEGLSAADEATSAFLSTYTTYLRVHARWAADELTVRRNAASARREAVRHAVEAVARTRSARGSAADRLSAAESALMALRARVAQLKASSAYQALEQLDDLERLVRTNKETAERAVADHGRRVSASSQARLEAEKAVAALAELTAAASRRAADLADHARAAGIGWQAEDAEPDGLAERVSARAAARTEAVRAIRAAAMAVQRAEQARDIARNTLERALAAVGEAEAAERAASAAVDAARERAGTELEAWWRGHGAVVPAEIREELAGMLSGTLAAVGEADAQSLSAVYVTAVQPQADRLRERQAVLRAEKAQVTRERDAAAAERDRIASERDDAPPPRPGREADTTGRPGAPLWQLVRFADGVADTQAAGLEAALEAAGLLDAWITPTDQEVRGGDSAAYLRSGTVVAGPSLADVLVADVPDAGDGEAAPVDAGRLTAILRSVAMSDDLAAHPAVITSDGRFAQGVQIGAHRKPHAEYIGATARRRRREARIAECDARIAALEIRLADVGADETRAADELAALEEARTALPPTAAVLSALKVLASADATLRTRREASDSAQAGYDEQVAAVGVTERALHRAAAEHRIDPGAADAVEAAVHRFTATAAALDARRREVDRQRESVVAAESRLETAEEDVRTSADAEQAARLKYAEEEARLAALRDTIGVDAEQVLAHVQQTEAAAAEAQREAEAAREAERDALTAETAAATKLQGDQEAAAVAVDEEKNTARGLAPYAQRELLDLLKCPPALSWPAQEADWSGEDLPEAVVAIHAAISAATRDLAPNENTLKASTTRLSKALDDLQAQLGAAGQDYRPEWDGADGVIVVRIADEQGPLPVGAFAQRIAEARRDQQQLLSESEQRILEDALLTRLAQQIHDRTVDSRDLIRRMNTEMRSRLMSSGATVGVSWLLADNLDEEQRAVCSLLDADAARLTPDAVARMRGHFATQIKNARARWRDRPYRELLADVLDYRLWRQFAFHLVRPDGNEERLTRARHSRLSGGEQSVSLHLPLFAAAHAMLNSAAPHAPRLLALDEAFAGVDDTGRGELLSLAAQFDLDLFMTGYDLWAAHASVPAAAHYDLSHSPVEHAVSALLLVWDGSRLLADDAGELAAALGSPGTRRVPAAA